MEKTELVELMDEVSFFNDFLIFLIKNMEFLKKMTPFSFKINYFRKKILIKSDGIFINGRDEIRLGSGTNQPVVRGDDLKNFLDELLNQLDIAAVAFKIDAPVESLILFIDLI